ncbi:hypothetical protein DFJ73DRAFT_874859 [Zopfochytrium polystomum]|nr:hypothetical protein DFJ73DRAFT_874859 [Zopfochytrium polystomum]
MRRGQRTDLARIAATGVLSLSLSLSTDSFATTTAGAWWAGVTTWSAIARRRPHGVSLSSSVYPFPRGFARDDDGISTAVAATRRQRTFSTLFPFLCTLSFSDGGGRLLFPFLLSGLAQPARWLQRRRPKAVIAVRRAAGGRSPSPFLSFYVPFEWWTRSRRRAIQHCRDNDSGEETVSAAERRGSS